MTKIEFRLLIESESEHTVWLTPEDRAALAQIGNVPWRDWHHHLYTCRQCQTLPKCSRGLTLLKAAQDQPKTTP